MMQTSRLAWQPFLDKRAAVDKWLADNPFEYRPGEEMRESCNRFIEHAAIGWCEAQPPVRVRAGGFTRAHLMRFAFALHRRALANGR